jgi:hypothetical protein
MSYLKRKPDLETESFKAWAVKKNSKEEKKIKKDLPDSPNDIEVKYKDMSLKLCGFKKLIDKKTNKLVFAFKVDVERKLILYYDYASDSRTVNLANDLKNNPFCYDVVNVMDSIKNAYDSRRHLENLNKNKK